jgi:hypothetical protein
MAAARSQAAHVARAQLTCPLADKGSSMSSGSVHPKHFLLVSDFDKTLSFNDSGVVLSGLLGASRS